MRTSFRVAVLIAALGCHDGASPPATAPTTATKPTAALPATPTSGPSGTITGVVLERTASGTQPAAGVQVRPYVLMPGSGYAYGPVQSDADGRFVLDRLPNALILLLSRQYQPCVSIVSLPGDAPKVTIEVTSLPSVAVATESPVVSGTVYERTPNGRRPVAGAPVGLDYISDLVIATAVTDERGRFAICRVPSAAWPLELWAAPTGYEATVVPVHTTRDTVIDIEVHR